MTQSLQENFSIIIPTLREVNNIPALIQRIANIPFNVAEFEVIIVDDDSKDGVDVIIQSFQQQYPWLKFVIRYGEKSLSQAVIDGVTIARYPIIIVMDADLSHPPEKIPEMLSLLANRNVDIVIGSRYVAGGSIDSVWPFARKIASKTAAALARLVIGQPVADPLSGFIGIRKNTILAGSALTPIGWKISLEMMVKCHCQVIKEIPIHFADRHHGRSKMNFRVLIQYLLHLQRLFLYKISLRKDDIKNR